MEEEDGPSGSPASLPLRSVRCNQKCKVIFSNSSHRPVVIFWLNYDGEEQRYFVIEPRQFRDINTFVTHPWIFRDSTRNNLIPADVYLRRRNRNPPPDDVPATRRICTNTRVFHPSSQHEDDLLIVNFKDQVYTLRDICYQKFIDQRITYESLAKYVPRQAISEYELFRTGQPLQRAVNAFS